jgi:hypothetical protein
MRFRKLRIAWSVTCGVAAVMFIVLWVRSYAWVDIVSIPMTTVKQIGLWSGGGRIEVYSSDYDALQKPSMLMSLPRQEMLAQVKAAGKKVDRRYFGVTDAGFRFPTYLLVLVATLFAKLPWIRWRFTLRTLLIAITAVAVVLGVVISLRR